MDEINPFVENEAGIVPEVFDPAAIQPRIPKLLLIDRLQAAGQFEAARTALAADPLTYERWQASQSVDPQNAQVRGLIEAIGGDVETLLAT